MRVVVRVPDRDVVLANAGDPAELAVDALEGRTFRGTVARVAESEEHQTRTMRVEIDLPNPDGVLREGMYGRATIKLAAQSSHLTLPVELRPRADRQGQGHGPGRPRRRGPSRDRSSSGRTTGRSVEVVSGLGHDDRVVVRSSTAARGRDAGRSRGSRVNQARESAGDGLLLPLTLPDQGEGIILKPSPFVGGSGGAAPGREVKPLPNAELRRIRR